MKQLKREQLRKVAATVEQAEFDADKSRESLEQLAFSLYRNNFFAPAAAIAKFLLGEYRTLDQAFGLKRPRRGTPTDAQTAKRDADVLEARMAGKSWKVICMETGIDRDDARKLCREPPPSKFEGDAQQLCEEPPPSRFERRRMAAMIELLSRQIWGDEKE